MTLTHCDRCGKKEGGFQSVDLYTTEHGDYTLAYDLCLECFYEYMKLMTKFLVKEEKYNE